MAQDEGTEPYLLTLDPGDVLAHPSNVREDLGDLTELTKTITDTKTGLVHYPVLVPDDDGYRIVAGHRRMAAAQQAGVMQRCVIRPDLAGHTPEQIAAMLNENTHRQALTPQEVSNGYAQLAMFDGWTPEKIATATGRQVEFVTGQLALAKLPTPAHHLAAKGRLDLEDAGAMEEFADQPKVMQRILRHGDTPSGVRHVIADERRKRQCRADAKAKIEALEAAGAVIIKKPKGYPYDCREVAAGYLIDGDGNHLNPDEAALKPGFAAFIVPNQGYPRVEVVCLSPAASGYRVDGHHYTRYQSPEHKAAKERERLAAERLREGLATATEVRHKHITETYGTAKAIKALLKDALRAAATDPDVLRVDHRLDGLVQTLAGVDPEYLPANASSEKINRVLVARWLAHQETCVFQAGHGWGDAATAAAFLQRLIDTGYTLSEAETTLLDKLHDRLQPPPPPRESPAQLDRPCEECGAEDDEECYDDCPLRIDEADSVSVGDPSPDDTEQTPHAPAMDEPVTTRR